MRCLILFRILTCSIKVLSFFLSFKLFLTLSDCHTHTHVQNRYSGMLELLTQKFLVTPTFVTVTAEVLNTVACKKAGGVSEEVRT